jgi:hypothetical protein
MSNRRCQHTLTERNQRLPVLFSSARATWYYSSQELIDNGRWHEPAPSYHQRMEVLL